MQGSGSGGKIKWPSGGALNKMGSMGYWKGLNQFINSIPAMIGGEMSGRNLFDDQAISHQLGLQDKYGSQMYGQQLGALNQLDPTGTNARNSLIGTASAYSTTPSAFETNALNDLKNGYALPDDYATELTNQIRGAQAARGNTEGNAAVSAESIFKGSAALNLYQQRMQNALQASQLQGQRMQPLQNSLALPGPIQQISQIQPVQSDRQFAFMNPNAGFMGQQGYQNAFQNYLGMQAANQPQQTSSAGGIGSLISSVAPIIASLAFSDRRLKKNISKPLGRTADGTPIRSFQYKGTPPKMPKLYGVLADELEKRNPGAVIKHGSGYKMVDYSKVV